MKSLIFIGSIGIGIACASATELRVSFDSPQSVAAIRTTQQDKGENRFDAYSAFELIKLDAKARFKAVDCLHVTYSKNGQPEVIRSASEGGEYAENDAQTLFCFAKPLKDVQRIDILHNKNGTNVYVITKNQSFHVIFDKKKPPKLEKINENDAPAEKPRLLLLVPQGGQVPTFKNG